MYGKVDQGHILSAGFGIVLIGFAGVNLLVPDFSRFSLGHVGLCSPVLLILYVVALRAVARFEKKRAREFAREMSDRYPHITLKAALLRYAAAGSVVVAAATWLPFVAVDLAEAMAWEGSFVATLFVAFVTSAPEIVVSLAALRIGATDMAVANILGSNLFDMVVLAIDDIFFLPGPLLSTVSAVHAVSAFSAVGMTGLAVIGLVYRPQKALFGTVSWVSLGILSVYVLNSFALYAYMR
jgi:cation:H+ antiporter